MLTISPMMVASVCHVGDPLQLICTGSVEFVRWNIEINKQGTLEEVFNRCTDAGNPMRSVSTTIHISQIGDFIN